MEDRLTFENIIVRHLNDPEDQSLRYELMRLRSLSADHEKLFLETSQLWELASQTAILDQVDEIQSALKLKAELGKPVRKLTSKRYVWLSTAAAIFLISALTVWFYQQQNAVTYLVKETGKGLVDSVLLADGSKVFLAENTSIRYPEEFETIERPITLLKGKAFFKVAKDPKRPFEVTINKSLVRVLGTSFNINYMDDKIDLSVKTGKVMFTPNSKSAPSILVAGEALRYDLIKNRLTSENGINATGWLTKELHFVDMPLTEVCRQLSAYYHVKVVLLADMNIAKKLNAKFSNTSIEEVLKVLKETYPISVQQEDSTIYIKNL